MSSKLDDLGIDAFCDKILDGMTYRGIARELEISNSFVVKWIAADGERSTRAREARISSAQAFDDEALETLKDKSIDPQRAREIASHLRWRASKIAPRDYGEKLQVDASVSVQSLSDDVMKQRIAAIAAELAGHSELPVLTLTPSADE